MINNNALLEPKLVGDIKGKFFIPAYQRGYRWEREHILMLLNDIWENGDANYCLQPIVVKKMEDETFELIDGQQRLTSLFLILKYMKQILPFIELKFSLTYQTRTRSEEFLESLDAKIAEDNIDFSHMFNAYKTISEWFDDTTTGDRNLKAINLYKYFGERVKVIWYEVNTVTDSSKEDIDDSTELFTRLNIGKIPLTNAELVKALFLSKDSNDITEEKQLEIATSWDIIERELQDKDFWAFLTNAPTSKYATRIELIFDLIANKQEQDKEKFFTFFYFIEQMKLEPKLKVWKHIQEYYLILKEWFDKRDIYHKVGYLVAIGVSLRTIIDDSGSLTKTKFEASLDNKIREKLNLTKDSFLELSYEKVADKSTIEDILLLFNIETTRLLKDSTEKYSFESHKRSKWSLEHIHAQQSVGLNKKEDQQEWMRLHKISLEKFAINNPNEEEIKMVIQKIDDNFDNITKVIFDLIFNEVFELLSENDERSYIDSITNMALLSVANNAALNNSTFDVKRNKILEMDKKGEYIPICTRRVFLKYYTDSSNHQLHFWGVQDREAYVDAMIGDEGLIANYLTPITVNV
jgi:uncharacterized protein with ParB-like and HNH nuclease domain